MKPIRVKHFHKMPIFMKILISLAIPLCIFLVIGGMIHRITDIIVIGAIPVVILVIAAAFFLNYGIKITSKRLVLMNQSMWKIFRYEDVIYMKITFDQNRIFGEIKAKYQKPYEFCFDGIWLGGASSLFSFCISSDLKLTKKFVDKSIADLSTCEKVRIKNLYPKQEKGTTS